MEKITKEQLAQRITGREYGDEIAPAEELVAKASRLVVIFGYSDDNMEVRGYFHDELGCFNGRTFIANKHGIFDESMSEGDTDNREPFPKGWKIEAVWCPDPVYSWHYRTAIPHATFEITEHGEPYCRGIVFSVDDL